MDHHAYLLIGNYEWARSAVRDLDAAAGPDISYKEYERFGIDDARELSYGASLAPVSYTHRVFFVTCRSFTLDAQNALLKLLEDPSPTARFYINVPSESVLIPTLRSRLFLLKKEEDSITDADAATAFLNASYADRLSLIEKYVKREDDSWATPFLDALEVELAKKGTSGEQGELLFIRTHIGRQGASKKMLLEHLALSLSSKT